MPRFSRVPSCRGACKGPCHSLVLHFNALYATFRARTRRWWRWSPRATPFASPSKLRSRCACPFPVLPGIRYAPARGSWEICCVMCCLPRAASPPAPPPRAMLPHTSAMRRACGWAGGIDLPRALRVVAATAARLLPFRNRPPGASGRVCARAQGRVSARGGGGGARACHGFFVSLSLGGRDRSVKTKYTIHYRHLPGSVE